VAAVRTLQIAADMTDQTRREFCTQACRLASVAALGGSMSSLLQACGGAGGGSGIGSLPSNVPTLPTVSGTAASGGVNVSVGASSPLSAVGSAALVQSASGLFLVAHTGPDTFTALTATCTHEACTIIGFSGSTFVCPCHGSRFSTSGAVQNGPATRSLRTFPTHVANDVLTISA
jgi:cytochrome b6-f complex iron-sulfur subunit